MPQFIDPHCDMWAGGLQCIFVCEFSPLQAPGFSRQETIWPWWRRRCASGPEKSSQAAKTVRARGAHQRTSRVHCPSRGTAGSHCNNTHFTVVRPTRAARQKPAVPFRRSRGLPAISIGSRYQCLRRVLVRALFFAAAERPFAPLVRTALWAAAERDAALRRLAARLACCDSARREAALRGSRFSTCLTARETRGRRRVLRRPWPASYAYLALRRVRALALPFLGGGRSMPARRASDRPIAMACCGDLAPCSP
jgi:hypothetical protein